MRPYFVGGIALLLFIGLSPGFTAAQQQPTAPPAPPVTQETPKAQPEQPAVQQTEQATAAQCSDCHDEVVSSFKVNPHARGTLENNSVPPAVCETCHEGASAHAETGDPADVKVPRGLAGADNTCLSCHDKTTHRQSPRTGMHANSETVNCLSCHSVHSGQQNSPSLLAQPELTLCTRCHGTQASEFRNKPYTHRIGRGGMGCSSCHEPHGRPVPQNVRRTSSDEPACAECHREKTGPHVFPHGANQVAANESGACMNCHEPHGSVNPNQLKRATIHQLCLECHTTLTEDTLGSAPPAFHNLRNPRFLHCTSCHVAVHGSNRSPQLLK